MKKIVYKRKTLFIFLFIIAVNLFLPGENLLALEVDKEKIQLIPGGESVGININTGVYVINLYSLQHEGKSVSPAKEAGMRAGDVIISINENKVETVNEVKEVLNNLKNSTEYIDVEFYRENYKYNTSIKPIIQNSQLSTGLYLKDKVIGIGTLSFVYPDELIYGALGHEITVYNDDRINSTLGGTISSADIFDVTKSKNGYPGEKRGNINANEVYGNVSNNVETGIYGEFDESFKDILEKQSLNIGTRDEIETGKAYIYTVLEGNEIEKFEIEIISLKKQTKKDVKGIKLKITDKRLLTYTGGIVQGMSGSPIIQNNKIVGAVTHVIVEDTKMGYGVYIEWMLDDAGIYLK